MAPSAVDSGAGFSQTPEEVRGEVVSNQNMGSIYPGRVVYEEQVTYAIICGDEWVKIGKAFDPECRLYNLQSANPLRLKLVGISKELKDVDTGRLTTESWHHKQLEAKRVRGEWFILDGDVWGHLKCYFELYRKPVVVNEIPMSRRRNGYRRKAAYETREQCELAYKLSKKHGVRWDSDFIRRLVSKAGLCEEN